jgi:hypothetical protein
MSVELRAMELLPTIFQIHSDDSFADIIACIKSRAPRARAFRGSHDLFISGIVANDRGFKLKLPDVESARRFALFQKQDQSASTPTSVEHVSLTWVSLAIFFFLLSRS